jgi:hypothetical protein
MCEELAQVDDGEIQHRRRHLQQQRDRILALKKGFESFV